MTTRTPEIEQAFEADPGFRADLGPGYTLDPEAVHALRAVYLDTPARSLTAAGWSLRRREGGPDAGWHLKRPLPVRPGRLEVAAPLADELPAELRAEVTTEFGTVPLVPVVALATRRRARTVRRGGEPVAVLAEDEVTARVGVTHLTWAELEVELLPDTPRDELGPLTERLVAAGARPSAFASKVARALAAEEPGAGFPPPGTAGEVLLGYAARQVGMLQAQEAGVRADAPDAVHKARVATRRLRSLLRTFRPCFAGERTEPLADELRWLGGLLGEPRDAEVLAAGFGDLFAELGTAVDADVRTRVLGHLAARHEAGHAALRAGLDTPRAAALRAALVDLLVEPPLAGPAALPAPDVLPGLVAVSVARVRRLARRAKRHPGVLERWHAVRKAAKAARYAHEMLADAALPHADEHAAAWEDVTETLGEAQDAAVARELVLTLAGNPPAPGWGVLVDIGDDRLDAALAAGQSALRTALELSGRSPRTPRR